MTVKHWKADTFAPIELTEEQKLSAKRIARGLVQDTLVDYDKYNRTSPRSLDQRHWKPVRTRDALTIYTERTHSTATKVAQVARAHGWGGNLAGNSSATEWQMPRQLVGTGSIPGTLDDVMYGTMTPDEAQLMQCSAFASVRMVDGQLLAAIEKPTPDQPYRSLTLQMTVNEMILPAPIRGMVKPRDLVVIVATGVLWRGENERIGYHLYHSLDLPEAPSQQRTSGIVRARLSQSMIFKEVAGRKVDVYMKGYYESFGRVMNSVANKVTANGLLLSRTASELSYHRKISWLMQLQREYESNSLVAMNNIRRATVCAQCDKRFNPLRKRYFCHLCSVVLCSNCGVDRRSIDIIPRLKAVRRQIKMCRRCMLRVSQESTFQVARQEVMAGRYDNKEGTTLVYRSAIQWSEDDGSFDLTERSLCAGEFIDLGKMSLSSVASTRWGSFINLATPTSTTSCRSLNGRSSSLDMSDDEDWDGMISKLSH